MHRDSFLVSEVVRYSPHSIVPWEDRIVENWWSLEKQFLHIFQKLEKDLEIQHQNWQTDGNPACSWERATSHTSTLSERTMESCMREVYDDSQRTAGQKSFSKQSSRPPDDEVHEMGGGERRFQSQTQQRRRAQAEERSAQKTQENVFVKRRLMTQSPKRPITLVPLPEDPVKRRLLKQRT